MKKKLPKIFKKKWLKALRSGKFKQGKEVLFDKEKNTYCCLGVACRVQGVGISQGDSFISDHSKRIPILLRGTEDVPEHLAQLNDGTTVDRRRTFKQIANYIEKHL